MLSPEEARAFIREGEAAISREQPPADRVVDVAWWARPSRVDSAPKDQNGEAPARLVRIPLDKAAAGGGGGADDDRGTDPGRVLSPEEATGKFIGEDGGAVLKEHGAEGQPRRVGIRLGWATGAGVVAAVLALLLLVLLVLLPHSPPTFPPSSKPTDHPGKTSIPATSANSLPPTSSVTVELLNADGSDERPIATYLSLVNVGFPISSVGTAPKPITGGQPSEIFYGPSGHAAAETLRHWLIGPVKDVQNANLSGNNLELWIASPLLGVVPKKGTSTTAAHLP